MRGLRLIKKRKKMWEGRTAGSVVVWSPLEWLQGVGERERERERERGRDGGRERERERGREGERER